MRCRCNAVNDLQRSYEWHTITRPLGCLTFVFLCRPESMLIYERFLATNQLVDFCCHYGLRDNCLYSNNNTHAIMVSISLSIVSTHKEFSKSSNFFKNHSFRYMYIMSSLIRSGWIINWHPNTLFTSFHFRNERLQLSWLKVSLWLSPCGYDIFFKNEPNQVRVGVFVFHQM